MTGSPANAWFASFVSHFISVMMFFFSRFLSQDCQLQDPIYSWQLLSTFFTAFCDTRLFVCALFALTMTVYPAVNIHASGLSPAILLG
jgi:hypothetical protein